MHKKQIIDTFDPNGVGLQNGNFIGLPFSLEMADIVAYPVPWDVTVSYGAGTSQGPQNILDQSCQLDLHLEEYPDLWKQGIFFCPPSDAILAQNKQWRIVAELHIQNLEQGKILDEEKETINELNQACAKLHQKVKQDTQKLLELGKKVVLVGGDHSSPLGYVQALAERHASFGILHLDAHCDLRKAYEGFTYSHASIFYNIMTTIPQVGQLSSVGIRDFCDAEAQMAAADDRIQLFTDNALKKSLFLGEIWGEQVARIIKTLPQKVYVSLDIDCLSPDLCPSTGTPVPGGLSYAEVVFLLQQLKASGREIIGADLCEVAGTSEWDGNVGARLLYQLMGLVS